MSLMARRIWGWELGEECAGCGVRGTAGKFALEDMAKSTPSGDSLSPILAQRWLRETAWDDVAEAVKRTVLMLRI
jgi:hypothetical protein